MSNYDELNSLKPEETIAQGRKSWAVVYDGEIVYHVRLARDADEFCIGAQELPLGLRSMDSPAYRAGRRFAEKLLS